MLRKVFFEQTHRHLARLSQRAILCSLLSGCGLMEVGKEKMLYIKEIETWQKNRETSLRNPYGWLSLSGLYWLPSEKKVLHLGSSSSSDIVLPKKFPTVLGELSKDNFNNYFFKPAIEKILFEGKPLQQKIAWPPDQEAAFLELDGLRLYLLKRSKGYAIRIKDPKIETLQNFRALDWHPISEKYRVTARFEKESVDLPVPDILGEVAMEKSAGRLVFNLDGKSHTVWALPSGEGLFLIFRDLSSQTGGGSYPSGRFLSIEGPIKDSVILDFNKAYNPPCAYTPWATCPLPPLKNHLSIAIPAGEAHLKDTH